MNIALVVAGGSGKRTGQSVPKQFLTVKEIPIIIYTLLNVKKSAVYDKIVVVIPDGWQAFMDSYCTKYEIKVDGFVTGGETRLNSTLNAVRFLDDNYSDDDFVSVIDANRPLIPISVFEGHIRKSKEISPDTVILSANKCVDSMFQKTETGITTLDRETCVLGQTPETARLKVFKDMYYRAEQDKINDLALSTLAIKYHNPVDTVEGSVKSFKITVKDDFDIFRALLDLQEKYINLLRITEFRTKNP